MHGLTVCDTHGGKTPNAKAAGQRRHAARRAAIRLGGVLEIDPAEAMLKATAIANAAVESRAGLEGMNREEEEQHRRWTSELRAAGKDAHAAGIDDRRMVIEESKAAIVREACVVGLEDLAGAGLLLGGDETVERFRRVVGRELRKRLTLASG